jgi:hypothetical protein
MLENGGPSTWLLLRRPDFASDAFLVAGQAQKNAIETIRRNALMLKKGRFSERP